MLTDALALLDAIRANPDEYTPRLMYADEIEGDDPARAELIRVQVELSRDAEQAGLHQGNPDEQTVPCPACVHFNRLRRRERDLLTANAARWRKGPKCDDCNGSGRILSHVHASRRKRCVHCYGSGDDGGLSRQLPRELTADDNLCADIQNGYRNRVEYLRGMKRVHALSDDVWGGEVLWRLFPWCRRVCLHHPDICELWLHDAHPEYWTGKGREVWSWFMHGLMTDAATVPEPVFLLLDGWDDASEGRKMWFDQQRARLSLARAVALWAHKAARR